MAEQPELSIVIVNWHSTAFVRSCLSSIYANTHGIAFEILVVDNASYDGCYDLVKTEFPAVRFIQNKQNEGFARANNLGSSHSRSRTLLFLNPDTEVVGSALSTMLSFLNTTANAGIVGARLLNSDHSIQTSCIQTFPSILNQAFDIERLRLAFPKCPLWKIGPLFENAVGGVPIDVVSGACLMVKRSVFEEVGLFTTDYFMYSEDVDLCWKVTQGGWKNYFVGDAVVIHHGGKSTAEGGSTDTSDVMMRESRLMFLRTSHGTLYSQVYRFTSAIVAACRLIFLGGAMALTLGQFRRARILPKLSKWAAIFRWAIGLKSPAVSSESLSQGVLADGTATEP